MFPLSAERSPPAFRAPDGNSARSAIRTGCIRRRSPSARWKTVPGGIFEPGMKTGSMVTAFINAYFEETHTPVIGVSASKGGSAIREWQPGSPFLEDALLRLRTAEKYLRTAAFPSGAASSSGVRGETDGDLGTVPSVYEKDFLRMLEALLSKASSIFS